MSSELAARSVYLTQSFTRHRLSAQFLGHNQGLRQLIVIGLPVDSYGCGDEPVRSTPPQAPEQAGDLRVVLSGGAGASGKGRADRRAAARGLFRVEAFVRDERVDAPQLALRQGEGRRERGRHGCEVERVGPSESISSERR